MNITKPIVAGAIGTSFMTLFSYGYSRIRGKQFREPVLLASLMKGKRLPNSKEDYLKGWAAHYLVGAVFSLSYHALLEGKFLHKPRTKGLIFGGLYGLLGAITWKKTFDAHPAPPKIDYNEYYVHLILAHLVFGYFAFGKLEKEANRNK